MKLHLGSGRKRIEGYVNVDVNPRTAPEIVCDLSVYPWPFDTDSCERVASCHLLEHLVSQGDVVGFNNFFRECWRILKPQGILEVIVPDARSEGAYADPSHKSAYNTGVFSFISKKLIQMNNEMETLMSDVEIDYDFDVIHNEIEDGSIRLMARAIK